MAAWQQTPTGYYPGQPAPPPGFFPDGGGYPKQPGYPNQGGQGFPPPPYSGGGFVPPVPPNFGHFPPGPDPNMHSYQDEPINTGAFAFSEKTIRMAFIRKVYAILMGQLAVTLAIGALFAAHEPTKDYVRSHPGLWWVAFVIAFVTLIVLSCFGDARRKAPLNYIFLLLFTFAESFLVGVTVSVHRLDSVVYAVGICAVVCLGLTVFAFQTKIDFTLIGGFLFVGVIILLLFSILLMIFPNKIGILIYACIGAFIFSLYIVYDTQMMIGGEHKYSISPEEYIFAALNLYIDIINLFLYILTIISSSRD